MKKLIFSLALTLLLCCGSLLSQISINIKKYIEDPNVVGENKKNTTVVLVPYKNSESALKYLKENSEYYSSLNDQWNFK